MGLEKHTPVNVSPSQRFLLYSRASTPGKTEERVKRRVVQDALLLSMISWGASEEVSQLFVIRFLVLQDQVVAKLSWL